MHVLLVEPAYDTRYPPLGLLKLSAWHRQHGDTVQLLQGVQGLSSLVREPQRVSITSLFTWAWRPVHEAVQMCRLFLPRAEIHLGGVYASLMPDHAKTAGADVVHSGAIPELEDLLPDDRLVPDWHHRQHASIVFTGRGCMRHCQFCAVPWLEGKPHQLRHTHTIRHLIHPEHTKAILWDNNILGQPNWRDVIEELKALNLTVDFNQGLDARLVTAQVAACLRGQRMPMIRVAYDSPGMGHAVQRAIEALAAVGFSRRHMMSYVLFNFRDTPEDLFERVHHLLDWGIVAYPMRFQPLDTLEKDHYVGPHWTPAQLDMVATARRVLGYGGAFPPHDGLRKKFARARNFEEAFGLWHTKRDVEAQRRRTRQGQQLALFAETALASMAGDASRDPVMSTNIAASFLKRHETTFKIHQQQHLLARVLPGAGSRWRGTWGALAGRAPSSDEGQGPSRPQGGVWAAYAPLPGWNNVGRGPCPLLSVQTRGGSQDCFRPRSAPRP